MKNLNISNPTVVNQSQTVGNLVKVVNHNLGDFLKVVENATMCTKKPESAQLNKQKVINISNGRFEYNSDSLQLRVCAPHMDCEHDVELTLNKIDWTLMKNNSNVEAVVVDADENEVSILHHRGGMTQFKVLDIAVSDAKPSECSYSKGNVEAEIKLSAAMIKSLDDVRKIFKLNKIGFVFDLSNPDRMAFTNNDREFIFYHDIAKKTSLSGKYLCKYIPYYKKDALMRVVTKPTGLYVVFEQNINGFIVETIVPLVEVKDV